ncbi:MAG: hypothetical protein HYW47_00115 [Deltaproteobacteria bacterium]|nr:hypothetical protein [Deltaproteobacteria bacterium]
MKKIVVIFLLLHISFFAWSATLTTQAPPTFYFDSGKDPEEVDSLAFKEALFEDDSSSTLLQFKLGFFQPQKISIKNEKYQYDYSAKALKTSLLEGAWDSTLFKLLGRWGLKTHVGYAFIKTHAYNEPNALHYLNIIPVGASLTYGLQYFKNQWIVPFFEAGMQYFFYVQLGKTDASYTSGGSLHPHWTGGLRIDVNNILSTLFSTKLETSYFIETQYREVRQPLNKEKIDFSQKNYFVGLSLGI